MLNNPILVEIFSVMNAFHNFYPLQCKGFEIITKEVSPHGLYNNS